MPAVRGYDALNPALHAEELVSMHHVSFAQCSLSLCLQAIQVSEERRIALQEQIAVAATQLLQDPEANLENLRMLLALANKPDEQVS